MPLCSCFLSCQSAPPGGLVAQASAVEPHPMTTILGRTAVTIVALVSLVASATMATAAPESVDLKTEAHAVFGKARYGGCGGRCQRRRARRPPGRFLLRQQQPAGKLGHGLRRVRQGRHREGRPRGLRPGEQGDAGYRIDGPTRARAGYETAGLGDVNGDGNPDQALTNPWAGLTYVVYGKRDSEPVDLLDFYNEPESAPGFMVRTVRRTGSAT